MINPNFDIADKIAVELSSSRTDHNELAKASTYLNKAASADDFFRWLEWMASPRVSERLARSNRTPAYYQQIRRACQQLRHVAREGDGAEETQVRMAQTLAWAVRLMQYQRVARPVAAADSVLFHLGRVDRSVTPGDVSRRGVQGKKTSGIRSLEQLKEGMELVGTVKRTAPFGAFVDIGVGRDGLVHVSKLREGYVQRVEDVVQVGQAVTVWVESVGVQQGRIALTMVRPATVVVATEPTPVPDAKPKAVKEAAPAGRPAAVRVSAVEEIVPGLWVKAVIRRVEANRIVVDLGVEQEASISFAQLEGQPTDPDEVAEELPAGTEIEARVLRINSRGRIQLTLKE